MNTQPVIASTRQLAMARAQADPSVLTTPRQITRPRAEDDDETEIFLYDAIDSWGGYWGINALEVAAALEEVDTDTIRLRINSPGGEVLEAIAIYSMFVDYPADVIVQVDAMAASAASFVAMAGDHRIMNRGAEMMIHNAWGWERGDANAMRAYADMLDRQTMKAAKIYKARAGAEIDDWLEAMNDETWYSDEEAVEAGLADEAIPFKEKPDAEESGDVENRWHGRQLFKYDTGRSGAPAPSIPGAKSTSAAPEAAPEEPAAPDAADPSAEARQRTAQVVAGARVTAMRANQLISEGSKT